MTKLAMTYQLRDDPAHDVTHSIEATISRDDVEINFDHHGTLRRITLTAGELTSLYNLMRETISIERRVSAGGT